MENETLSLCKELLQKPSITPHDAGCQDILKIRLEKMGFTCEVFDIEGVKNLWAKRGQDSPCLCFAGHTDVVPIGDESKWLYPPFSATIEEQWLYGRGAADMKGAIAAMITATEQFIAKVPHHKGSIAFLITSDEEGPAVHGTQAALEILNKRQQIPEWCLVGEPSCTDTLGDTIKIGRRGSLHGFVTVVGKQGHVAYPHLAKNPIHFTAKVIEDILNLSWVDPIDTFPPTSLQFTNIQSGTGANNVIPNDLTLHFNCRYAPPLSAEDIMQKVEQTLNDIQCTTTVKWQHSSQPFYTNPDNALVNATLDAVRSVSNQSPKSCTSGGTSDGRFFALYGCDVVELGLVNQTIHQINERIDWQDLEKLSKMYANVLSNLLAV